jgi:Ca2+-binding RTX toxin-like protein
VQAATCPPSASVRQASIAPSRALLRNTLLGSGHHLELTEANMARIRSAASTNTSSASVTPYPAAFATCRKWRRTINGGNGSDTLFGGTGDDKIIGGSGNDAPYGGHNSDTLSGWGGDDSQYGGEGDDFLYGNQGHDTLDGGNGDDRVSGGNGNDRIIGGQGKDIVSGGTGADVFEFKTGDLMDWDVLSGTPDDKFDQLDVITDFTFGSDKMDFSGFSGVDDKSD